MNGMKGTGCRTTQLLIRIYLKIYNYHIVDEQFLHETMVNYQMSRPVIYSSINQVTLTPLHMPYNVRHSQRDLKCTLQLG